MRISPVASNAEAGLRQISIFLIDKMMISYLVEFSNKVI